MKTIRVEYTNGTTVTPMFINTDHIIAIVGCSNNKCLIHVRDLGPFQVEEHYTALRVRIADVEYQENLQ